MSIPTQISLTGFFAGDPQIHFSKNGTARFYARVGVEHFRKEVDGSFTQLDSTFHDMVAFEATAERAHDRFRPGDSFVASGYIHEYEVERDGSTVIKEEFVARKPGHDTARTRYDVQRRRPQPLETVAEAPTADTPPPAVGF
jgi:single-stranded DNA-binding protein